MIYATLSRTCARGMEKLFLNYFNDFKIIKPRRNGFEDVYDLHSLSLGEACAVTSAYCLNCLVNIESVLIQ